MVSEDALQGSSASSPTRPDERADERADLYLTIDLLDAARGMAEVEDTLGRSFELPAGWLPGAAEGAAYRVQLREGGVQFQPLPGGAREIRERSKQTLLAFSDEHDDDNAASPERP